MSASRAFSPKLFGNDLCLGEVPQRRQILCGGPGFLCPPSCLVSPSPKILLCRSMGFWVSTPPTLLCFVLVSASGAPPWGLQLLQALSMFVRVSAKPRFPKDLWWPPVFPHRQQLADCSVLTRSLDRPRALGRRAETELCSFEKLHTTFHLGPGPFSQPPGGQSQPQSH